MLVHPPPRASFGPNTAFIGPRLGSNIGDDSFNTMLESSVSSSIFAQQKRYKTWAFSRNTCHSSVTTDVEFNFTDAEPQSGGPQGASIPTRIRPIAECAEYDLDELDFITTPDIVEEACFAG
ncbi:hypothetical protein Dda_7220 [Drechslerella dactyloides]|uniref:Uncharacterized protein n=1 Tax=Drechslerella dactyloides TaxID=74499 RepID=A0AAD6IS76_DREDA|nr:hypothetical protein Dda_7220 [Drechslerella dactyloides]